MPECLFEHKGKIANLLPFRKIVKMPAETVGKECLDPKVARSSQLKSASSRDDYVNEEPGSEAPRNGDSLLYTLATAAASRSSPGIARQEEATTLSPKSAHQDRTKPSVKRGKQSPLPDYNRRGTHRQENCTTVPTTSNGRTQESTTHRLKAQQPACISLNSEKINPNSVGKHTNQLHLMEAMMHRQKQMYEEYEHSNNWMKVQRNDSNCLSKSKAKRYRWCVQKDQEKGGNESFLTPSVSQYTSDSSSVPPYKKRIKTKPPGSSNHVQVHDKLYGSVFTGASKLRCRDCGKSFATLVDLTVHMSKTGHYRDQNIDEMKGSGDANDSFVKPKNRLVMDSDEKESAEKVLKCLGCGHAFDSLQDLTVHMIKTKHYEDVPSLRLYSQKSDYCASTNEILQSVTDEKSASANQLATSSLTADYSARISAEALKYPSNSHEQANLNFLSAGSLPPAFGSQQHSFANMLSMAALRLLGFPPYFMQMPFSNAVGGYDMASAAYATAAARMLLSSPWLTQIPSINAGPIFPPFLNPHATTTLPPTMLPHARQQYSVAGEVLSPAHSSSSSQRSAHQASPGASRARNGSLHQHEADVRQNSKSHVLRCVQCGESFASLQQMTDHMRETTHFPIAMTPPTDETNHRRASASRCSSAGDSIFRCSPQSKGSPQHPQVAVPTSSPLEQLAKLASGKSLDDSSHTSFARPSSDYEHVTKPARKSSFPTSESPPARHRPPSNHSYSGESYVCPASPLKAASDSPTAGFDFIKSIESTIQSAISRVNQPPSSPAPEKQVQSSCGEPSHCQKSQKQRILDSFLPATGTRVHRKSLPSSCERGVPSAFVGYGAKAPGRPASDSEEYYRKEKVAKEPAQPPRPVDRKQHSVSPPLDLSKPIKDSVNELPSSLMTDDAECKEAEKSGNANGYGKNPIQCIKDDMQSLFETDARKLQEKNHAEKRPLEDNDQPATASMLLKSSKRQKISVKEYKPGLIGVNPLKEMQKIVNATEITVKERRNAFSAQRNLDIGQKRKLEAKTPTSNYQIKGCKASSVLSDLVRHDEGDPLPTADPLAQMENLVNLKIGRSAHPDKSSTVQCIRKPNLPKPYFPHIPDAAEPSQNGTNPMSALLNFFARNGKTQIPARTTGGNRTFSAEKTYPSKGDSVVNGSTPLKNESNDADHLKEKMVEFFRSMIAQGQPLLEKKSEISTRKPSSPSIKSRMSDNASSISSSSDSSVVTKLTLSQEMRLQALFASHFEKKSQTVTVSDQELRLMSTETGLSTASITEWVSSTEKQLREHNQCSFLRLSTESDSVLFSCVGCAVESTRRLSARDFLHHISTHIDEMTRADSTTLKMDPEEGACRKEDKETLYRGAVHFKSLRADNNSPEFSLAARVAESSAETSFSAPLPADIVARQKKHVDVVEDGPIKVSG